MNIHQLNADFGITGQLRFVEDKGGLPFIEIENSKASALVSLYAGQLLSFKPINEPDDLMFLSNKAYYQEGKAIKGGIPVCWPWFGPDPEGLGRPGHGFVRNRLWTISGTEATSDGQTQVKLGLVDTPETREIWPQAFELELAITVGSTVSLELLTRNRGDQAFSITQAFHTYFKVGDINQVRVLGLEDSPYLDKVDNGTLKTQTGAVSVSEEVDRIYTGVKGELVIEDAALGRRIHISSAGSETAVVWNPWAKISADMGDLEDDDYLRLICVETANAASDIVNLLPDNDCRLLTKYTVARK